MILSGVLVFILFFTYVFMSFLATFLLIFDFLEHMDTKRPAFNLHVRTGC